MCPQSYATRKAYLHARIRSLKVELAKPGGHPQIREQNEKFLRDAATELEFSELKKEIAIADQSK